LGLNRTRTRVPADRRPARTPHPDAVALDRAVEVAAATVLLEEGVEGVEEGHVALVEHVLLDHVVRSDQDRLRDREAERPRGLEVDDQFEFCRLLHG
jgi:hypothetical protein